MELENKISYPDIKIYNKYNYPKLSIWMKLIDTKILASCDNSRKRIYLGAKNWNRRRWISYIKDVEGLTLRVLYHEYLHHLFFEMGEYSASTAIDNKEIDPSDLWVISNSKNLLNTK